MRRVIVLACLALTAGLLQAAPAHAACPPPGGVEIPSPRAPEGDFQVVGGGWGHGVGMSQYGAQGAALSGCSADDILTTYYRGVTVPRQELSGGVVVGLFPDRPEQAGGHRAQAIHVYANGENTDQVPWRLRRSDGTVEELPRQPARALWRVHAQTDGRITLYDITETGWPVPDDEEPKIVWQGGDLTSVLQAPLDNRRTVELPSKSVPDNVRDRWTQGRPYKRGVLQFRTATQNGASDRMDVTVALPSFDQYLYGLAEMPSSWRSAALQAQAITGRSYALAQREAFGAGGKAFCRCHVWDSPSDQVYSGFVKESEPTYGASWVQAVDASTGKILWHNNRVATGYYSSSHGGQSESNAFSAFFGGNPVPYLQPVDDSRWEMAVSNHPVLRWAHAYTKSQMGAAFGMKEAYSVRVLPELGAGGRVGVPGRTVYTDSSKTYGGVEVTGIDEDGSRRTVVVSGLDFVQRVGVTRRSEMFQVFGGNAPLPPCTPAASQQDNDVIERVTGPSRFETAVAASQAHWETSEDAVLATGESFADALSSAALAARLDAPLLLSASSALHPATRQELARLEVSTVHLMGGGAALSPAVEEALTADGYTVRRIAGASRFETAKAAALAAGASESGDAALALGEDWPDAVSAGGLAGSADRVPTLLASRDGLPQATLDALAELEAQRVLVIGGPAAVSDRVLQVLRDEGYEVERRSGPTRYDTSIAVARDALERGEEGERTVLLASGEKFPDALAAGALSARLDAALVLVPHCDLSLVPRTETFLGEAPFGSGVIVGGSSAVSELVREQATAAITDD